MKPASDTKWKVVGNKVRLKFEDGSVLYVKITDFYESLGGILYTTKEDIADNYRTYTEEEVRALNAEEQKNGNKSKAPKLIRPQQYGKVMGLLEKRLTVKHEADAISLGFTKTGFKKQCGRQATWFSYDATDDIGFPCLIDIATENEVVVVTKLRLPLFFREHQMCIPGYTMMQHLECMVGASVRKLDLKCCIGPVFIVYGRDEIKWNPDRKFDGMEYTHSLQYMNIEMVNRGIADIYYLSRDEENNMWLICMTCERLPEEIRQKMDDHYSQYLELQIYRLTKREGIPFKTSLYY